MLEDLPRANRKTGRIVTREQQAYDVYWRRNTTDAELTAWARSELPIGARDPIAPWMEIGPGNLAVPDHIVPVERMKQFYGFARLSEAEPLSVLNLRENLMAAVSSEVNGSRLSKSYSEWIGPGGRPIPEATRRAMQARERELAQLIDSETQRLLAAQEIPRGTVRPPSGTPGAASRLLGVSATALSAAGRRPGSSTGARTARAGGRSGRPVRGPQGSAARVAGRAPHVRPAQASGSGPAAMAIVGSG